jgi:spore coat protein JB
MESNSKLDPDYYKLLHRLQAADFVLVELTLYLDTHPEDLKAIEQFNQYAHFRRQLADEFERCFGPLMQFGHSYSRYPWDWKNSPWPWQV